MKINGLWLFILISFFTASGCMKQSATTQHYVVSGDILESRTLTAEEQKRLTPEQVLEALRRGNLDFVEDRLTVRNTSRRVREAAMGQYPKAVVLSCLDSRVPVEDVFHAGIGDLFVARVAGNVVDEDILGSLEYACHVSGAKVILVLGHGDCGAIKSAIKDVKLGNITALLSKIRPVVTSVAADFEGAPTAKNPAFVEAVCEGNVIHVIREIRENSPILKALEEKGDIRIAGAIYDMETGRVDFR